MNKLELAKLTLALAAGVFNFIASADNKTDTATCKSSSAQPCKSAGDGGDLSQSRGGAQENTAHNTTEPVSSGSKYPWEQHAAAQTKSSGDKKTAPAAPMPPQ